MAEEEKSKSQGNAEAKGMQKPEEPANLAEDAIGACYFVDTSGQSRCKITSQSLCNKIANSEFYPGKRCPDI